MAFEETRDVARLVIRGDEMGKPTGFLELCANCRSIARRRSVRATGRVHVYDDEKLLRQRPRAAWIAACRSATGVQLPSGAPVPVNNLIPEWNDLVYRGLWRERSSACIAPTLRISPAASARPARYFVRARHPQPPVAIKTIEAAIIERGWKGWVIPDPPKVRTGKRVAVVGAGPPDRGGRATQPRGHLVTVLEREDKPGGC